MRKNSATFRCCCMVLVAFFCAIAVVQPVNADPIETLSVEPALIELDRFSGRPATIRVIALIEQGEDFPKDATLTTSATSNLLLESISGPDINGDAVWTYKITAHPDAANTETIGFRLRYVTKGKDGIGQIWPVKRVPVVVTVLPKMRASPADGVKLKFEIGEAPLTEGISLNGYLVITNAKDTPVTIDSIAISGPDFLKIETVESGHILAANATTSFPVVARVHSEQEPLTGKWVLIANVDVSQGDGASRRTAETTSSIMINVGATPSPIDQVTLEIKKSANPVIENAPLNAYLVVKNQSDGPVTIKDIKINAPEFIRIGSANQPREVVNAKSSYEHPFTIGIVDTPQLKIVTWLSARLGIGIDQADDGKIEGIVKPRIGTWLLLAQVSLSRTTGDHIETGTLLTDTEVVVGVPGVSDVLKVLELPTVLLIPGALVLAIWGMFSVATRADSSAEPSWLKWKSSGFWVIAVTLSILIFMSQSFWGSANYLVGFNTLDIAWLWLVCVAGAAVTFALFRLSQKARRTISYLKKERDRRRNEPLTTDQPLDVLRKLIRFSMPFYLESFERDLDGQKQTLFSLGFPDKGGTRWVVPKIIVKRLSDGDTADALLERIYNANDDNKGLEELIKAIECAIQPVFGTPLTTVYWENGLVATPLQIPIDQIANPAGRNSPVELDASSD